jgi:hypothetical protein
VNAEGGVGENAAMTPLLAETFSDAIVNGVLAALPVAGIAALFGFVYWLVRRRKSALADAERKRWLDERRAKREAEKHEPADR